MNQTQGLIGEKLGSFRIESVLGSGAMGVVYRGINEKNGRPAAVKVVSAEFAQGGKIRDRFEREAEILQQFRHPNIVRFLAVGRFRGTSYIAMEYVEGITLEKAITDRGSLPWREVVPLGVQICDALHYAHEHGVVHRDLKPSNLMITPDGQIKLTDFGIAKDLDATALTATGRTLGTAAYMSPEQIRGTPAVSHKTDLYALGVVFYQMLVGKPPFEGATPVVLMHNHLNEPPPRPSAKIHEIPKALDELIVTLMAKAPADRPWDAAAVGVKLTELREKMERGAAVAMVWPSAQPGGGKSRGGAVAAGARLREGNAVAPDPTRKKTRKSSKLAFTTGRQRLAASSESPWLTRSVVETGLLALALVVTGGFIAYWVWPPSKEYLYHQAEALMASSRRADWVTARDEFLKPLDDRFPTHPYREQTQKWRDKILLDEAEGRAKVLGSGLKISISEPVNDTERQIVIATELAAGASGRGDDQTAARQWQELADHLNPNDPDQRKWSLLALHRVAQVENAISDRRQYVLKQFELAEAEYRRGRFEEAAAIRSKLLEQYARFTDLADIFPKKPPPLSDASKVAPPIQAAESPSKSVNSEPPSTPAPNSEPQKKSPES
jgi:serine/threonine-protein kinase